MARGFIGRVRGEDGVSPVIEVKEDTLASYRLHIKTKTDEFDTPNLRGATFRSAVIEILGQEPVLVPFSELALDPAQEYMLYAAAGMDYPLLRNIVAIRVGDMIRITIYTDTSPYTTPQVGSPFPDGIRLFGEDDLHFGDDDFDFGAGFEGESFPVNLLVFER